MKKKITNLWGLFYRLTVWAYLMVLFNGAVFAQERPNVVHPENFASPASLTHVVKANHSSTQNITAANNGRTLSSMLNPEVTFFNEAWDVPNFNNNEWTFQPEQGSWLITGSDGNPMPSALFYWSYDMNYTYALVSKVIDISAAQGSLTLSFDLYLDDNEAGSTEYLKILVNNGLLWTELETIPNAGNIPWTTYTYNINDIVGDGNTVRIKFEAYGSNAFNIDSWFIDNISVYENFDQTPEIHVNPETLAETLAPDQTSTQVITVANTGNAPLTFDLAVNLTAEKIAVKKPQDNSTSGIKNRIENQQSNSIQVNNLEPGGVSPRQTLDATLRYDVGGNLNAIGLVDDGSLHVAAYWPASAMSQYTGMKLSQVEFYISDPVTSCVIRIFGQGASNYPGTLLHEQVVTPEINAWNIFDLTNEVYINGDDLWISYTIEAQAGYYPVGVDNGPPVIGFGDMMSYDGINWFSLTEEGAFDNWNLVGYLIDAGPVANDDAGVDAILSPLTWPGLGEEEVVTIRIKNYGNNQQSNIPVSFTLDNGQAVTGIFEGSLMAGETAEYSFDQTINLSEVGQTYILNACTSLSNDENPANDCRTRYITNVLPIYCDASTVIASEYISNVMFGDINNQSGWQNGIADFTALSTAIDAGQSEMITIIASNSEIQDQVTVWVDWNANYVFEPESNEEFILTNVNGTGVTFTGLITVPEGIPDEDYRMRIRLEYNQNPEPCGESDYGEIEEYTLKVGAGAPPEQWLSANIQSGTVPAGESMDIIITFDSHGLASGSYQGSLVFTSNDPANPTLIVPVSLDVSGASISLPFIENWDSGNYTENNWTFDPGQFNWRMRTDNGSPSAPSAWFDWEPTITNYSIALLSPYIDVSNVTGILKVDFDLLLNDYDESNREFMKTWVLDGNEWVLIGSIGNQGDLDWTSYSYSVPDLSSDLSKIKFEATGVNSYNINYWLLDHIKVYESSTVDVPQRLIQSIVIYPVPAADILNIRLSDKTYNSLRIFNAVGQIAYALENINQSNLQIDLKNFNNGVYFAKFTDKSGLTINKKFVVKH